jgi:hypothetical protein
MDEDKTLQSSSNGEEQSTVVAQATPPLTRISQTLTFKFKEG